jgi:fatty-acyl-CoA synthase
MAEPNIYERDLERQPANYAALTPLRFLTWSAEVYPDRPAVIHGVRRYTWKQTHERAHKLAAAISARGIGRGDTVSVMLGNTPEAYEAHFGVPMSGAVLNALNTRLDADAIAFMLGHAETKLLITDREFSSTIKSALERSSARPILIDVDDPEYAGPGERLGELDYEAFLATGDPNFLVRWPADEWDAIALNYTSGTTGNPKGVVYHHRGAHLNAVGNMLQCDMPRHSVYLWTLPMFHCNGWCFPWTMAANAGVNVCLRRVDAGAIFDAIRTHKVTHYCGAPIVHTQLVNAPEALRRGIDHKVRGFVGGAAPPATMIEGLTRMGFELTHVYGLTEVYGPSALCARQDEWADLDIAGRAERNGRQGVRSLLQDEMTVVDPHTMQPVAADGQSMGEIVFRGNLTMKGYLKNPKATAEAFAGGYFHSGDLAVLQPDGYAKIKDRAKDIIISGGENISSLEVEDALCRHPAVLMAAVVAQPDAKWGESPCAFIELKSGAHATESELIEHCRAHVARFKVPKRVVFGTLPKTSTGKIQKFVLRQEARSPKAIE